MLYKTGVEYGDYTMNFVQGCSHGCKFPCYAYLQKKRFGQIRDYETWCTPALVSNTLDLLRHEIPRLKHKITSVHLCFTTDPFMYGYNEIADVAMKSIQMLNDAGIKCTVLTKGLLPLSLADLSPDNEYGITLVSLDKKYCSQSEPGAAPCDERLLALKELHDAGARTWVSMEPYPTPNIMDQNLAELLTAVRFTDKIIFGRTNYSKEASAYKTHRSFYNECATEVVSFCERHGIANHIKRKTLTREMSY